MTRVTPSETIKDLERRIDLQLREKFNQPTQCIVDEWEEEEEVLRTLKDVRRAFCQAHRTLQHLSCRRWLVVQNNILFRQVDFITYTLLLPLLMSLKMEKIAILKTYTFQLPQQGEVVIRSKDFEIRQFTNRTDADLWLAGKSN